MRLPALLALLLVTATPTPSADLPPGAEALLGTRPPDWQVSSWLNSPALSLADLRGRAVLVRWLMDPRCPYCSATAPSLVDFHRRYAERGLTVVGLYHHKGARPLAPGEVERYVEEYGFEFPVAVDVGWRTLRAWWLDPVDSGWTSVSFLLDREGVIRHVHPGGSYAAGDADHAALEAAIERVLAPAD